MGGVEQEFEPTYGGLIMEVSENDFLLGGNIEVNLEDRAKPDEIIFQYNQAEELISRNGCTVFGSSGAVDDLVNRNETNAEVRGRWIRAINLGASEDHGWAFYKAVDLVRKEYNAENPTNRVASFRISNGDLLKKALDYHYSLVGGYKGNAAYNLDKEDGTLEGVSFPGWTYAHCVRIRKMQDKIVVIDNYQGVVTHNIYSLEHFDSLVANGVFFNEFYIFVSESMLTESQKKRLWAKAKGLWNGQNENIKATRGEVVEMAMNATVKLQGKPQPTTNIRDYAKEQGIWNGENGENCCTRSEAALILERAIDKPAIWSGKEPENSITRWEVAEILANMFA